MNTAFHLEFVRVGGYQHHGLSSARATAGSVFAVWLVTSVYGPDLCLWRKLDCETCQLHHCGDIMHDFVNLKTFVRFGVRGHVEVTIERGQDYGEPPVLTKQAHAELVRALHSLNAVLLPPPAYTGRSSAVSSHLIELKVEFVKSVQGVKWLSHSGLSQRGFIQ